MIFLSKLNVSAVLALTVFAAFSPSASASVAEDILDSVPLTYETFTLDNGLRVIVHSDHKAPTVFVGIWYGVGSRDEPPGKTGFAHLFEHLMFQGTANRDGEYMTPIAGAGGFVNGTTNQDRTNYLASVPTSALDRLLWMESDRMAHLLSAISEEAVDEQRAVVKNEKRQRQNQPYSRVGDLVASNVFPVGHPYHHSIVGSMEDLDNASLDDVHEWFREYYGASNAVLVLSGDVTLDTAKEKVTHYFSDAPAGQPLLKRQDRVPALSGIRRDVLYDRVGQTRLVRAWPVPGMNHDDAILMQAVGATLASNKNSPLYRKLVDELRLATTINAHTWSLLLGGVFALEIDLVAGADEEQVWSIVDQAIATYRDEGPDDDLLEGFKLSTVTTAINRLDSKEGVGMALADGMLYADDPMNFKKQHQRLVAADSKDLRGVASRQLTENAYELTVRPFPDVATGTPTVDRGTMPELGDVGALVVPAAEKVVLDNGLTLVVVERGNLPMAGVTIVSHAGSANTANLADVDVSQAVTYLRDRGSRSYEAQELVAAMEQIGMNTTFRPGPEYSKFEFRLPTLFLEDGLELATEMLVYPTYPDDEMDKFRAYLTGILDSIDKTPSRRSSQYLRRAVWGADHPFGQTWSRERLPELTSERLRSWNEQNFTPSNTTVYVTGNLKLSDVQPLIQKTLGKWTSDMKPTPKPMGKAAPARARVVLIDQAEAAQSSISVSYALPPYDPEVSTEMSVLNNVLGGSFSSRMNLNLREDKGWTYGMNSRVETSYSGDEYLVVQGSVQSDKTIETMQEIFRELEEINGSRPITQDEFDQEVQSLTRALASAWEWDNVMIDNMISSDGRGLPYDHIEGEQERLRKLTLEKIRDRAQEVIRSEDLIWLVIGDMSLHEEAIRALDYGDVEVWDVNGKVLR